MYDRYQYHLKKLPFYLLYILTRRVNRIINTQNYKKTTNVILFNQLYRQQ